MSGFKPHTYAESQTATANYAKEGTALYRWVGTHWTFVTEDSGEEAAYHWLRTNDRDHTSAEHARRCYRALVMNAPSLPPLNGGLYIPCQNGYVTLANNHPVLVAHDKAHGLRHVLSSDFLPDAPKGTRFERFLVQVIPDAAVRERVQEYVGYTLTSDARHQRVLMLLGPGANGKGVLARITEALHGDGVGAIQLDRVDGFALSGLIGKSLIVVDEVPRARLNEQSLKTLFAGERIYVDIKHKTPISTRVPAKWLILGNNLPVVTDHSNGFWRRWDIVPFSTTIPEQDRNPMLAEEIIEYELPAVLNWALMGLTRLQQRGQFDPVRPAAIEAAILEAKRETNSVLAWITDCGITSRPDALTIKNDVFDHYRNWCGRSLMHPHSVVQFWKRLSDLLTYGESRPRITGEAHVRRCTVFLPDASAFSN
jgi:putative DNA primase/helicase